jgi:hypothetical protein
MFVLLFHARILTLPRTSQHISGFRGMSFWFGLFEIPSRCRESGSGVTPPRSSYNEQALSPFTWDLNEVGFRNITYGSDRHQRHSSHTDEANITYPTKKTNEQLARPPFPCPFPFTNFLIFPFTIRAWRPRKRKMGPR